MSLKHGRIDDPHPRNTQFTRDELLEITPNNVVAYYLNLKAYHDPYPGPNNRPLYHRAGSLHKAKQAISYFMPDKLNPWTSAHGGRPGHGNPTRSLPVNACIAKVEELETKGLGSKANDKQASISRGGVQQNFGVVAP